MASELECALLCSMASNRESRILGVLEGEAKAIHQRHEEKLRSWGWEAMDTSEELNIEKTHGYYGVAYYKLDSKEKSAEIVIAHRGTRFDEHGNILADIAIAKKNEPRILRESAFLYVKTLFNDIDFYNGSLEPTKKLSLDEFTITKITHTGFSLGGYIAGACVGLTQYTIKRAITFDAPGISNLITDKSQVNLRIINYVTKPNLVNTCNEQVGIVREIASNFDSSHSDEAIDFTFYPHDIGLGEIELPNISHSGAELEKLLNENKRKSQQRKWTTIAMNELNSTKESHNLGKIIISIENDVGYHDIYKWPSANNEIIYGEKPRVPSSIAHFGAGNVGAFILSAFAIGLQISQGIASDILWEITENQQEMGVIGFGHKRQNKVFYTQGEYTESLMNSLQLSTSPNSSDTSHVSITENNGLLSSSRTTPANENNLIFSEQRLGAQITQDQPVPYRTQQIPSIAESSQYSLSRAISKPKPHSNMREGDSQ